MTFNAARLTDECLASLARSIGHRSDIEVVLVDNGSSDIAQINDYSNRLKLKFIKSEVNLGVAGGRNLGIANCSDSEYIMFLDNDTVVHDGTIERLMHEMDRLTDIGIAGTALVSVDGHLQNSFKNFPGIREKLRNVFIRNPQTCVMDAESVMHPFYIIGACQIIRREVIDKIGLLDEKIFFGPEDADYCMRVREAGYKVGYFPQIKIIHHWQRATRRNLLSATSRRHFRGLLYFYRKWHRWW